MKAPEANELSMSKETPERVSTIEEGPQKSAPRSPLCEFDSAGAPPSHVSEEAVSEVMSKSNLMARFQSLEETMEIDEVVMHSSPVATTSLPQQEPEAAEAEAGAGAESAAEERTVPLVSEGPAAAAAPATPEAETTAATPAPEVAARQMQEMWENLGKGYKVDWQKQDIGIDIGGRPSKRQKLKQKQQNMLTTSHDQQDASVAHMDTGKDRTDSGQNQKKPGEENLQKTPNDSEHTRKKPGEENQQKTPNDSNMPNTLSEMSSKQEQSTVEVGSTAGRLKESAGSSRRQACGQWMPRGGRCSRCRGKMSDEFGGVVCRRRRADGTEVGCCKGVCWRCMKPTPGDDIGKIRTTKRDFQALGRRAWWLHESCMTSSDEADYFLLIMPTPT